MLYTLRGVFPTEKRILLSRKAKIVMTKNSARNFFFVSDLSQLLDTSSLQTGLVFLFNQLSILSIQYSLVGYVIKPYSPRQKTQLQLSLILKKV